MCVYNPFCGQAWSRLHQPQSSCFANRTGNKSGYKGNCRVWQQQDQLQVRSTMHPCGPQSREFQSSSPDGAKAFSTPDSTAMWKLSRELTGTKEMGGSFSTGFHDVSFNGRHWSPWMSHANLNTWDLLERTLEAGHRLWEMGPTQDRQTREHPHAWQGARELCLCLHPHAAHKASSLCHQPPATSWRQGTEHRRTSGGQPPLSQSIGNIWFLWPEVNISFCKYYVPGILLGSIW